MLHFLAVVHLFTSSDSLHIVFIYVSNLFLDFSTFLFDLCFLFLAFSVPLSFFISVQLFIFMSLFIFPLRALSLQRWPFSFFHFDLYFTSFRAQTTRHPCQSRTVNASIFFFFFLYVLLPLPQQFDFKFNFQLFII